MRRSRVFFASLVGPTAAIAFAHAAGCGNGNRPAADAGSTAADAAPDSTRTPYGGLPVPEAGPRVAVHADFMSAPIRTDTMQLMFAAGEMQTSGEPFASNFAGRNLNYFLSSRYLLPPDQYVVTCSNCQGFFQSVVDLFGFSTAVESYEYSKYHMNIVANQSGAGVSLINGPLLATLPGATSFERLRARMEALIAASGANVAACDATGVNCSSYAQIPPPANNPLNDFGFPGLWPNLAPYRSFDVSSTPDQTTVASCTSVKGYGGVVQYGNNAVFRYECDYNSLRLNDPERQSDHVIGPGILGYATWKEALWAVDFIGRLHDSQASAVTAVAPRDMPLVGRRNNTVQAIAPPMAAPGVFIGSTPLEGMWGLTMIEEMDNAAAWLLSSLATGDGHTMTGWASVADAIHYGSASPLLWFPAAIGVTIAPGSEDGGPTGRYPQVASLAVIDATSRSIDLAALAQGYSLFFGMTDTRNVAVGQQIGMQVTFGGSLFAADDGLPDGENSPHDRALGVMRVAFVDLDRLHVEPATGVAVDTTTVDSRGVTRGTTVSATALGHVVVGLRHLLMACNASVTQYGAPDSDPSKDDIGILNEAPQGAGDAGTSAPASFSARVREVLVNQARFVRDTLTTADGTAQNGATLAGGRWSPTVGPTTLESQSAVLRVLVEAWFLTGDASYRDRARSVAGTLLTAFWSDPARMFRGHAGGADDVVMTPEIFGWLQQALRMTHEALWVPGDALLDRSVLEDRIARTNKLYLNGWDDLNGDRHVDKESECLAARLQLGEQALTGEIGENSNGMPYSRGPDRDSDCVVNVAYPLDGGRQGGTSAVLASEVHFYAR